MGRAPCCDKANVKRGPWSPEEDAKLKEYIDKHGTGGNWIALPQKAGLKRCGKSCRLRWLNYLRPNIKHGEFSDEEDRIICSLYASIGSRWSIIASQLQGRTDNDIKNYWNTKLKKKLIMGIIPQNQPTIKTYPPFSLHHTSSKLSPYSSPSPPLSSTTTSTYNYLNNNYTYENMVTTSSSLMNANVIRASASETMYSRASRDPMMIEAQIGFGENQDLTSTNECKDGYGENSLDYGFEEIKELISTSVSNSNNNNLNLFLDENKTEEKVLYF